MAWAGTVTDRGSANSQYENSADITAWQGAANSLCCVIVHTNVDNVLASDISGHDAGSAWVEIANIVGTTETRRLILFAAHEGSSPANEALIVNVDDSYIYQLSAKAFEITDVKVDGTVLESFGTPDTDETYPGSPANLALSIGSYSNSEGLSLLIGMTRASGSVHTSTGYAVNYENVGSWATLSYSYLAGEDTSQTLTMTFYSQHNAIMVEVVGVAAGGASVPIGPLTGPFGGPLMGKMFG